MQTKSHLTANQLQLKLLGEKVMAKFDQIMLCLNVSLKQYKNMYVGPCPIHGGDKSNALNIYHTGEDYIGNWKCRTQQCEKVFVGSIIGFIRGVLSHQKYGWTTQGDPTATFPETIKFIENCLDEKYDNVKINFAEIEKNTFIQLSKLCNSNRTIISSTLSRETLRRTLKIPAEYFLSRGYTARILDKYDVGLCTNRADPLYNRIVVPIYNDNYSKVIANTSRSIYDQCLLCNTWHSPEIPCPNKDDAYHYPKWRHSYKFKKEDYFYNYWFARKYISENKIAIITESPGNVWRLEEAGIPVGLATFGASFSDEQFNLLNQSGAMTLILAMDNDEAGQQCTDNIIEQCKNIYTIDVFTPPKNDIGDMTIQEVKDTILPLYTRHSQIYDNLI